MENQTTDRELVPAWTGFLLANGCDPHITPITLLGSDACSKCSKAALPNLGKAAVYGVRASGFILFGSAFALFLDGSEARWDVLAIAGTALVLVGPWLWRGVSEPSLLDLQSLAPGEGGQHAWKELEDFSQSVATGSIAAIVSESGEHIRPELFAGNRGRALLIASYSGTEREIDATIKGRILVARPAATFAVRESEPNVDDADPASDIQPRHANAQDSASMSNAVGFGNDRGAETVLPVPNRAENQSKQASNGDQAQRRKRLHWLHGISQKELRRLISSFRSLDVLTQQEQDWFEPFLLAAWHVAQKGPTLVSALARNAIAKCNRDSQPVPHSEETAKDWLGHRTSGRYAQFRAHVEQASRTAKDAK